MEADATRKRRRIAVDDDEPTGVATPLRPAGAASSSGQSHSPIVIGSQDDDGEIDEPRRRSIGPITAASPVPARPADATSSVSPPAPATAAAAAPAAAEAASSSRIAATMAALMADDDDDEVMIVSAPRALPSPSVPAVSVSSVSARPQAVRKRARVGPLSAAASSLRHGGPITAARSANDSPPPPPLSPVSEPDSPSAPPLSPVSAATRALDRAAERNMEEEEAAAVSRARRRNMLERREQEKAAATSSAAVDSSAASGALRRRKPGGAAAASASSFASASLLHSYTGLTSHTSSVAPQLIWHQEAQMTLPTNPADRLDVERTFLQQVLIWDPHAHSPLERRPNGGGGDAKSNTSKAARGELAAFAKFLDLSTPLPVHFTSPLAFLGYFGPLVLDNFRAQLVQTVEENMPAAAVTVTAATSGNKTAPAAPVPGSGPGAERHRSCWTVLSVQTAPTVGGDDWFEVRLKLAQAHRSIGQLCGADIVVIGIDLPITAPPAPPTPKPTSKPNAFFPSGPGHTPPAPIPPPSSETTYVFAFLDRVEPDGSSCFCRVRLFLPGVSSAMSSYVAPSAHATRTSRFQIFFNRLQQAALTASNPIEEGGKNANANFTPMGAKSTTDKSRVLQPVYLTRVDTIITTIREYTALVKVACLLPLRLQPELLRPSPSDEVEDADSGRALVARTAPRVVEPLEDLDGPPALETLEQVAKQKAAVVVAPPKRVVAARTGGGGGGDAHAHLDSPAWIGLPPGFRDFVQTVLNPHQLKAVQVALKRYEKPGFTLLQGPPGTGKSKTVVSLLNALHLGAFQRHYDSLIAHVVEGKPITPKPRILVCAPSNTAVDELITRVVETGVQARPPPNEAAAAAGAAAGGASEKKSGVDENLTPDQLLLASLKGHGGFVDGQRARYRPDIVRVGHTDSIRPELKSSISLDALVDQYHRLSEADLQGRLVNARNYIAGMDRALQEACAVYAKSRRLFQDMKATLDSLAALGHDVRAQPQYAAFDRLRADFLARQSEVAHCCEKRLQAMQDIDRCELALRFKTVARVMGPNAANSTVRKEREAAMDALRISFLNGAQIVFCTLSGSGLDLLSRLDQPFQALIVDEAAQSTEVATLIPLAHDVQHCILVGDPRQLPATVFTLDSAARRMWERSLFERLEQSGHQMHALTTQYRMHPDIRQFPSDYFYEGQLSDADTITKGTLYKQPYHPNQDFKPILFYDLQSSAARGHTGSGADDPAASRSLGNAKEALFVVDLLSALLRQFPRVNPKQIGIITFYQKQKQLLQDELRRRAADEDAATAGRNSTAVAVAKPPGAPAAAPPSTSPFLSVEVSTVDGFQGREKEIIVVSCVRGGSSGGLGFVDDVRRMNVALTRAKYALWVVGDARALRRSPHWSAFLDSVTKRNRYQPASGHEFAAWRPRPPQLPPPKTNHPQQQPRQQPLLPTPQQEHFAPNHSQRSSSPHAAAFSPPPPPPPGFSVVDLGTAPPPPRTSPLPPPPPPSHAPHAAARPGFTSVTLPPRTAPLLPFPTPLPMPPPNTRP